MISPRSKRLGHIAALCAAVLFVHTVQAGRYALLVGNNTAAGGNFAELKYVKNDIAALRSILADYCGFEKTRIVTLYNSTPDDLDRSLRAFADTMAGSSGNMFLFYYSGHADQNSLKMGDAHYRLDMLKRKLNAFPSDIRIGMFDACQSGVFTRIKGGKLDEPFLFRDDGKTKGQVILCSSSLNENAQESDALGNSVFTFHIVNALRGSGDQSGDGRVTLSEAYHYAYNHTLSTTAGSQGGVQHPSFQFRIQGEGDIVLADLNITTRGLLLGPDISGAITITGPGNAVVADLIKEKNGGCMIALAPGVYTVINARGEERYQASVTVAEGKVTRLQRGDLIPGKQDYGRKKGVFWKGLEYGCAVGGGAAHFNFTSTESSFEGLFGDVRESFAMDPRFTISNNLATWFFQFSMRYKNRLEVYLGMGMYSTASTASFSGYQINPFDSGRYGAALTVDYSTGLEFKDMGAGYLFRRGLLKNGSVHVGLSLFNVNLSASGAFTDSLHNATSGDQDHTFSGETVVPYGAIGYEWPFAGWASLCSSIRVRAAPAEAQISGIRWDLRGIDGNAFIRLNLSFLARELFK